LSSLVEIVGRMPKLNLGAKQEPIGAWFPKRHAHTARIQDSNPSNRPVKLHVGMTSDDHWDVESFKDWHEAVFRRETGKNLSVVSRCGMAKQHFPNPVNLDTQRCGPTRQQLFVFRMQLLRHPAHDVSKFFRDGA